MLSRKAWCARLKVNILSPSKMLAGVVFMVAINPRWQRVKIVDSLKTSATMRRFARLDVTLPE